MDNLETSLASTADKACENAGGAIVERFIKPKASTIFGHPAYYMDRTGTSIALSGPYKYFSKMILVYV